MKVTLINHTPDALETLVFTKNTRLRMTSRGLEDIKSWPIEKKLSELEYMLGTIQSSWEFVDYIFMIEGVTRAFTHQLVRHRSGTSFAQQSQRTVDMSGFDYETGVTIRELSSADYIYKETMLSINKGYHSLIKSGIPPQDARGVLPTNIHTNIVFKANLRTLHEMALKRLCVKTQGEFQDVFRAIRDCVLEVHPWTDKMLRVHCAVTGTCCFPTFPVDECPVKSVVYNPETRQSYGGGSPGHLEEIQNIWKSNRGFAQPKVVLDE